MTASQANLKRSKKAIFHPRYKCYSSSKDSPTPEELKNAISKLSPTDIATIETTSSDYKENQISSILTKTLIRIKSQTSMTAA